MADVFSKKCRGCNAILSLRESCKACADKARARLHAEGVASSEEREIPHLSMWGGKRKRGTWAEDEGRPPLAERQRRMFGDGHAMEPPPAPHGFQLHGLRGARFGAVGSLDEWAAGGLEAWTRSQSYEPPPVGAEVSYEVALRDMQKRPVARYIRSGGIYYRYTAYLEAGNGVESGPNATWLRSSEQDEQHVLRRWTRLPDGPAIGEEVAWDVAKADMQARSEARYKISSDLGVEYSYAARGTLSCRNGELEAWRTSVMYEDACDKRRWVRLA